MPARFMVAATASGSGKTTITCALLAALQDMGNKVISYKCGPDYIDPMFHRKTTGVESRNLDLFLMREQGVRFAIQQSGTGFDIAVLEGVMGLYDGQGNTSFASSNHLSVLTGTPVVLVVNARGMARSVCALIAGFMGFERNNIKAVILNNIRESSFAYYKQMIERELKLPVIGYMPTVQGAGIESRHLGLVTAQEIQDIQQRIDALKNQALSSIDFEALVAIAESASGTDGEEGLEELEELGLQFTDAYEMARPSPPKIYVANDEAFCFFYSDNHDLLAALGAELVNFSPLHDSSLPDDADGVILWGGYPELHAAALESNLSMRQSLANAIEHGLPVYAECGGFMYLQQGLTDQDGFKHRMLGVLPGNTHMTDRLQDFGYFEITAQTDNLLCRAGEKINAHFFHHSVSDYEGDGFVATKRDGKTMRCIVAEDNIFAGYQHLHFYGNPSFAVSFVKACDAYREAHHGAD